MKRFKVLIFILKIDDKFTGFYVNGCKTGKGELRYGNGKTITIDQEIILIKKVIYILVNSRMM